MEEEKENNSLPELTTDQWNEVYLELSQEANNMLAQQLIEDRKLDDEADFAQNNEFSAMAIESQAEV